MKTVIYERPVHYYETDQMGCVHHSNYIRWFEESRAYLMDVGGFPYIKMEEAGIVSPVIKMEVEYLSMTKFGETVEIEVGVESYTGSRIGFAYTVRDKATGKVRCRGRSSHCFLNSKGHPVALRKVVPEYDRACREAAGGEEENEG